MHDLADDPDEKKEYECLRCGELILAESHPGTCPECGAGVQGRKKSLE